MVYSYLLLVKLCIEVKFYHLHAKINKKSVIFAQNINEKIETNRKYNIVKLKI